MSRRTKLQYAPKPHPASTVQQDDDDKSQVSVSNPIIYHYFSKTANLLKPRQPIIRCRLCVHFHVIEKHLDENVLVSHLKVAHPEQYAQFWVAKVFPPEVVYSRCNLCSKQIPSHQLSLHRQLFHEVD